MKTTHKKAIDAYIVLVKMSDIRRAPATQIKLFKLKKMLQIPFEFVSEEEKKLVEDFGGTVTPTGQIVFEGSNEEREKKAKDYNAERLKLLDLECEIDLEKPMPIHSTELKEISLAEMESLDGFIDFE